MKKNDENKLQIKTLPIQKPIEKPDSSYGTITAKLEPHAQSMIDAIKNELDSLRAENLRLTEENSRLKAEKASLQEELGQKKESNLSYLNFVNKSGPSYF